jgi:hypothetical protein
MQLKEGAPTARTPMYSQSHQEETTGTGATDQRRAEQFQQYSTDSHIDRRRENSGILRRMQFLDNIALRGN